MHIYMNVCVCVCVCVRARAGCVVGVDAKWGVEAHLFAKVLHEDASVYFITV
jgi:hypothetical protein